MEIYRGYVQPGPPHGDDFRVFRFDVASDLKGQYSQELKDACKRHAGPQPAKPTYCPRCGTVSPIFASNLCYKAGYAGAWNMVCLKCRKVHFPTQRGPTAAGLEEIETIRARDYEVYLERKAQKATQSKKARAKPRKEDTDVDAPEEPARPFGILNNAEVVFPGRERTKFDEHEKKELKSVARVPPNYLMKGKHADAGNDQGIVEAHRTVQLVFWAAHQEPVVEQVPVQFDYELFLYELPAFQGMRDVFAFERYSFEASLWCDLPWRTSPIWIAPEDDVIFVRAWRVQCLGFGRHLDRYQRMHGLALRPAIGIRATVNVLPAGYLWLVIWGALRPEPEIHPVDLSYVASLDDDARVALPWAHLIADAPFVLTWRDMETGWGVSVAGETSAAPDAPMTLVAHPAAESLVGSGEAIAWLEERRLGGDPKSRPTTQTRQVKDRPAKRVPSGPAKVKASRSTSSLLLTRGDRASAAGRAQEELSDALAMAGEWFAALSHAPVIKPEEPLPVSGPSNLASNREASVAAADEVKIPQPPEQTVISNSDDKFAKVEGALVPSLVPAPPVVPYSAYRPASTISDDKGDYFEARAQSRVEILRTDPHGPEPSASASSDDDVEIVEGPAQPRLEPDHTATPPAVARSTSPSSDDDVEIVEGPSQPRLGPDQSAVTHAAARSASTISDDDVEIVDGPGQPRVARDSLAVPPTTARSASPSSDGDVEIVEGPVQPRLELAQPAIQPAGVQPAGSRSTSASSEDDVKIVDGPAKPRFAHDQSAVQPDGARFASATLDEVAMFEGGPPQLLHPVAHTVTHVRERTTRTASDDEVEMVEEAAQRRVGLAQPPVAPPMPDGHESSAFTTSDRQIEIDDGHHPSHVVPDVPLSKPHQPPPTARDFAEECLQPETGCSRHVLHGPQTTSSHSTAMMGSTNDGGVKSEAARAISGEVPRVSKRAASPLFDSEMGVVEEGMAQEEGCWHAHKKIRTSGVLEKKVDEVAEGKGKKVDEVAEGKGKMVSKTSVLVDDDIVWIEAPSDELKRAFEQKAATAAHAVPHADTSGTSRGHTAAGTSSTDSDDEVEFVDNASVVPKRRVSNVHGKQFIDMT